MIDVVMFIGSWALFAVMSWIMLELWERRRK